MLLVSCALPVSQEEQTEKVIPEVKETQTTIQEEDGTQEEAEQPVVPTIEQQKYTISVVVSPPEAGFVSYPSTEFEPGTQVTLSAIAAKDHIFKKWAGDASGSSTNINIVVDSNKNITAHFERSQPSVFEDMDIHDILESTATIQWHTSVNATFLVQYGTTESYGLTESDTVWTDPTDWGRVVLTGLKPQATYHLRVLAVDTDGNQATSDDFTFTTLAPKGIYSVRLFAFVIGDDSAYRVNTTLFNNSSQTITVTKIEFLYEDDRVNITLPSWESYEYDYPTLGRSDLPEVWQNWQLPAGELLFTGMEFSGSWSKPLRELIGTKVKWYLSDAQGVESTVIAEFSLLP